MTTFHVLASVPRSGSTLLANILNQNPRFCVSDTSPLGAALGSCQTALVQRPEYLSLTGSDATRARDAVTQTLRGLTDGWIRAVGREGSIYVDKDRSAVWLYAADMYREVFPETKILCLVRDPREVIGSALRNYKRQSLVLEANQPAARSLAAQVGQFISPQHVIGSTLRGIEDLLVRGRLLNPEADNVYLVQYEELVRDPAAVLGKIYEALGEEPFAHDFENVTNVSTDMDFLYRNLWPHEGSGKVMPRRPTWPEYLPRGLAQQVVQSFPLYCETFGYR